MSKIIYSWSLMQKTPLQDEIKPSQWDSITACTRSIPAVSKYCSAFRMCTGIINPIMKCIKYSLVATTRHTFGCTFQRLEVIQQFFGGVVLLWFYLREVYPNLNNLLCFSCESGSYALWLAAVARSQQYWFSRSKYCLSIVHCCWIIMPIWWSYLSRFPHCF